MTTKGQAWINMNITLDPIHLELAQIKMSTFHLYCSRNNISITFPFLESHFKMLMHNSLCWEAAQTYSGTFEKHYKKRYLFLIWDTIGLNCTEILLPTPGRGQGHVCSHVLEKQPFLSQIIGLWWLYLILPLRPWNERTATCFRVLRFYPLKTDLTWWNCWYLSPWATPSGKLLTVLWADWLEGQPVLKNMLYCALIQK